MVGNYVEVSTFQDMTEISDRQVRGKEFSTKGAVAFLCRTKETGEERKWLPVRVDKLLKGSTDAKIRSVKYEVERCVRHRMHKKCCRSKLGFDCVKIVQRSRCPGDGMILRLLVVDKSMQRL